MNPRVWLAAALFLGACSKEPAPSAPTSTREVWRPPAPVSVVLILLDTLRADAIFDPAGRYETPNIDRLCAEGVAFPSTFSAAPMTLPSHMSLFSSRPPFETGVLNNGQLVPEELPLVADWLSDHGYHTRAVISLGTLDPLDERKKPSRGFDSYDHEYWDMAKAEVTKERLFASLAQRNAKKPLFLFAHFSDPHEPYNSHGSERRTVELLVDGTVRAEIVVSDMNQMTIPVQLTGGRSVVELRMDEKPQGRFRVRRFECRERGRALPIEWEVGAPMERVSSARLAIDRGDSSEAACELRLWLNDVPIDDAARRRRYALEVNYLDRYVGELLNELERLGLYQDSLVVLTSDHGESLGERKHFGHVEYLTNEQLHVPLIVKLPRNDPRRDQLAAVADKFTTHLDLVPTILELVGVPALPGQRGTSLLEPHESVHIAQTTRPEAKKTQIALRDAHYSMVFFPDEERFELYDLQQDPGELKDVFAQQKGERKTWPDQLRMIHRSSQSGGGVGEESDEEREAREAMLRALGYIGGDEGG